MPQIKRAAGVRPANLFFENFEAIADAAMRAWVLTSGRRGTPSAKWTVKDDPDGIVATRTFKAIFRKELARANFSVWAKGRSWA